MSDPVIIQIITGVVSIITLVLGLLIKRHVTDVHKQINSRMDELLELNKTASKAEGKIEEQKEQLARQKKKPSR